MAFIYYVSNFFILLLFLLPSSSTSTIPICGVRTTLSLKSPVSYINVCRCPRGHPPVISGIDSPIPLSANNTVPSISQASASLSCFQKRNLQLASACDHGIPAFRQAVEHAVNDCVLNPPPTPDVELPFTFGPKNEKCKGFLFIFDDGEPVLSLVLACACRLDDENRINVVNGRAQFQPKSIMEKEEVETCTRANLDVLTTVCQTNPKDFEVLSKQIFQTCCKRSRATMGDKLECQPIVPDDLSGLEFLAI